LQHLAKSMGIRANAKSAVIIRKIIQSQCAAREKAPLGDMDDDDRYAAWQHEAAKAAYEEQQELEKRRLRTLGLAKTPGQKTTRLHRKLMAKKADLDEQSNRAFMARVPECRAMYALRQEISSLYAPVPTNAKPRAPSGSADAARACAAAAAPRGDVGRANAIREARRARRRQEQTSHAKARARRGCGPRKMEKFLSARPTSRKAQLRRRQQENDRLIAPSPQQDAPGRGAPALAERPVPTANAADSAAGDAGAAGLVARLGSSADAGTRKLRSVRRHEQGRSVKLRGKVVVRSAKDGRRRRAGARQKKQKADLVMDRRRRRATMRSTAMDEE
jgi:hypothetical protein